MLCLWQTSILIFFPGCKINIGLSLISKRKDGFHNLQSIFYPVNWSDVLEIHTSKKTQLYNYGTSLKIKDEDNLAWQAYQLLKKDFDIDPVQIHLLKNVPNGAGLGGGSADASAVLLLVNDLFNLNLSNKKLEEYAATLGSDCPFFIKNEATLVTGRGEVLKSSRLSLKDYYIYLINPGIHISTKLAFSNTRPMGEGNGFDLNKLKASDISNWKHYVVNDFEKSVFAEYKTIKSLKNNLYNHGALYASMTGTGSSVYGIFREKPVPLNTNHDTFIGKMN